SDNTDSVSLSAIRPFVSAISGLIDPIASITLRSRIVRCYGERAKMRAHARDGAFRNFHETAFEVPIGRPHFGRSQSFTCSVPSLLARRLTERAEADMRPRTRTYRPAFAF